MEQLNQEKDQQLNESWEEITRKNAELEQQRQQLELTLLQIAQREQESLKEKEDLSNFQKQILLKQEIKLQEIENEKIQLMVRLDICQVFCLAESKNLAVDGFHGNWQFKTWLIARIYMYIQNEFGLAPTTSDLIQRIQFIFKSHSFAFFNKFVNQLLLFPLLYFRQNDFRVNQSDFYQCLVLHIFTQK
ncbi:Hypothetical_protein [Hexamita inflata]|uniref:Hypothetical_protein n=1 Tax=Hexamita inflata TaxID=28002 RepID=A0AA86TPN2_9EUKA|nr:Hypothetical protein HINF_LOCUS9827 [Hexamita inflata]